MRLGLFGGTFNPIHLGHLKAAEEIIELACLDRICFIPSFIPPHKKSKFIASAEHRLNMIKLTINDNPKFCLSDFEISTKGISYTINTLKYFSKKYIKDELYFIVGNDIFNVIESWMDYRSLFIYSNFIVVLRPGTTETFDSMPVALSELFRYYEGNSTKICYMNETSKKIIKLKISGLDISSSEIRENVRNSKPIKNLVTLDVEDYIHRHNLFVEGVNR